MNREIKFRAWDDITKELIFPNDKHEPYQTALGIMIKHFSNLMQCTSLKDKNEKEIYEFDICKFYNKHNQTWYIRVVRYCPMFACFGLYPNMDEVWNYESDWLKISEIEIIGNLFQNPKLLEALIK